MAFEYNSEQTKKQLRKALDFAKANPDHEDSQELRRRMEKGQFNFELKSMGLPPVPVKKPQVDLKKAFADVEMEKNVQTMKPGQPSVASRIAADAPSDIAEVGTQFERLNQERSKKIQEIVQNPDLTVSQKIQSGLSQAIFGSIADAINVGTTGAAKVFSTPELEQKFSELMSDIGENETVGSAVDKYVTWYEGLSPEAQNMVDSVAPVAEVAGEITLLGKGAKPVTQGIEAGIAASKTGARMAGEAGQRAQEGLQTVARTTGEALDERRASRRPAQIAAQQEKVDNAIGRILQAGDDPRAIEQAKRALTEMDTSDVKTYDDLNNTINDQITVLSRKVDDELDKVSGTFGKDDLVKTTQVGDEVVTENPVEQAIQGLEEAYTKSGEAAKAARIRQLNNKLNTEGLTLREVNELAREYGIEYRDRAFNKMGEAKAGYNAENYENVRKGVKEVLRDKMPNDISKELDSKISDLYSTRNLTQKIEDKVAKLQQRITNRTLAQKVGGALAGVVDLATFGGLRGFVARLLPSNMGNKAMNSLEIEEELTKNLKEIDKLLEMQSDEKFTDAFVDYVQNVQGGMSIRSTVTPLKVGKQMTEKEFDMVAEALDDLSVARMDPEFNAFLDKNGLSKADDAELERFLKEATDQFETPEDAPPGSFNQSATTKTTDLLEEARKYDSAEEFVKSLPTGNELDVNTIGTKTGDPVRLRSYHGTKENFDKFRFTGAGDKIGRGGSYSGRGFYFTPSEGGASGFGNVKEVVLNLKNPFVKYLPEDNIDVDLTDLANRVREQGYDSLIVRTKDVDPDTRVINQDTLSVESEDILSDQINEIVVFDDGAIFTKEQLANP